MTSLLIFVVIATVLVMSLLVVVPVSYAVVTTTIAGLNNYTALLAVDNQYRLLNIAKLHNASSTKIHGLDAAIVVLDCVNAALHLNTNTINNSDNLSYSVDKQTLQECDDGLTSAISNHTSYLYVEDSNQTIINIAKEYLKSRGIQ